MNRAEAIVQGVIGAVVLLGGAAVLGLAVRVFLAVAGL